MTATPFGPNHDEITSHKQLLPKLALVEITLRKFTVKNCFFSTVLVSFRPLTPKGNFEKFLSTVLVNQNIRKPQLLLMQEALRGSCMCPKGCM